MKKRSAFIFAAALLLCVGCASANIRVLADGEESTSTAQEEPEPAFPRPVADGYVRYEAEYAQVNNAKIKGVISHNPSMMYGVYSGEGFVGEIDHEDSSVTFTIEVPEKGNYLVEYCYAIGTDFGAASFNISINGKYYSSFSCSERKGWGNFGETNPGKSSLNLDEGVNTVVFSKGYNYSELDYIDLGVRTGEWVDPGQGGQDSPIKDIPEGFTRYEAEDAFVNSGKIYTTGGTFSGKGYVGNLDWAGQSHVDFTVHVEEDGEYPLHIAYAIGFGFEDATYKIFNDEGFYGQVSFTVKNGWGVFAVDAIAETAISLRAGNNIVGIYKSAEYAQIDFIDVGNEAIGEYKESSIEVDYPNLEEGWTRYEAEEQIVVLAEPRGIGFFTNFGTYSGFGYVGQMDTPDRYVEFPITVPEDGEYEIKICYATAEDADGPSFKLYSGQYQRDTRVYFYGETTVPAGFGWGEFSAETIVRASIPLRKGRSFMIFRAGLIPVELDYIDLGSRIGDYHEGTVELSLDRAYA